MDEAQPAPPTRDDRRLLAVELAVVLSLFWLPGFLSTFEDRGQPHRHDASMVVWSILRDITRIALLLYLPWSRGESWRHFGLRRTRVLTEIAWGAAIWVAHVIMTRSSLRHSMDWLPLALPRSAAADSFAVVAPLYYLTTAAYEELLMRGYFWNRIQRLSRSRIAALIATSLLFAAGHNYDLGGLFRIFCAGLLYGCFRWLGRSLPRLVLAHWAWDLFVFYR